MSSIIRRRPMGEFMYLLFFSVMVSNYSFSGKRKRNCFYNKFKPKKISLILAKLILLIEWISGYPILFQIIFCQYFKAKCAGFM